jgi:DNA-binding NarL/FixJ family response regulator
MPRRADDVGQPGARKSKVFLVDDHPILRQGLGKLINDQPDMTVCGEAENPPHALEGIGRTKPDLVLLDLSLAGGDGMELCRQLQERFSGLPVLVVSMHDESLYAERCLRAGAMGYVMKQEPPDRVVSAMRKVLSGNIYLSEAMSEKLLRNFSGGRRADAAPLERLSDRELEIFRLIGKGHSVRAIAEQLFLSPKTVEAHKEHIKQKLNLKSSNELLQYAIEARDKEM